MSSLTHERTYCSFLGLSPEVKEVNGNCQASFYFDSKPIWPYDKADFQWQEKKWFYAWLDCWYSTLDWEVEKGGQEHLQAECSKTMFISAIIHHLPCHWEFQDYNTLHSGKMSRGRVLGRKCFRLFILNMCSAQHHTEPARAWAPGERCGWKQLPGGIIHWTHITQIS